MTANYLNKIKEVLFKKFGVEPEEVESDSYFTDDLNLSELEIDELLVELEEIYHTSLMEEKEEIKSVEDLIDLLVEKLE